MAFGEYLMGVSRIGGELGELIPGQPTNLNSYQNVANNVIVYWTFDLFTSDFYSFDWELQTDLVDTFDSPDLLDYSSTLMSSDNYITGCIHRGMVVPIYPRLQGETRRMYWRVRATTYIGASDWTASYYDIPAAVDEATRTSLLSFLPDALYSKEPGTEPGVGSNIYKIHDDYAKEFENANKTLTFVNNDLYVKSARDSALQSNFGDLLGMRKPDLMKMVDYREILRAFMINIRYAPSVGAIRNMVYAIYRNDPTFINIRDVYGEYVYDTGIADAYVLDAGIEEKYIWDNNNFANGTIIEVPNELACSTVITDEYVMGIIRNMVQDFVPVYMKSI